jgi:hypothetical protein
METDLDAANTPGDTESSPADRAARSELLSQRWTSTT